MKSGKNVLLNFVFIALLSQLGCIDNAINPAKDPWEKLGLEGKIISQLKLTDNYLYACAGKDGLYRFDLSQSDADWTYLGLADTNSDDGVRDVISVEGSLLVSYVSSYRFQHSGIYKSIDDGKTWFSSDSGMITTTKYPTTSYVNILEQHPSNPDIVFAGTLMSSIYKSDNAGLSWKKVGTGASNYTIRCNSNFPSEVWAGGRARFTPYLLHSTDGGETWSDYIWFPEDCLPWVGDNVVNDIAINPANDNIIYFGMHGLLGKTIDKGKTFTKVLWQNKNHDTFRCLSGNPYNPLEIFAAGSYLYRTKDGGESWQEINPPLNQIYALAVDWQQSILYVSESNPEYGIYKLQY